MHAESQSLIENDTWDYRNALSGQVVLASRSVFNIKKDRRGKNSKVQRLMDST